MPVGRLVSCFSARCVRSWRPFCWGWPGLIRSMATPSLSHQTESLERLNRPFGLAKGTPLSERIAEGKPRSLKSCSKAVMAGSSRALYWPGDPAGRIHSLMNMIVGGGGQRGLDCREQNLVLVRLFQEIEDAGFHGENGG